MFLVLAIAFFSLFVGHVVIGSISGASLVGDVGELIILICASITFVIAILDAEKKEKLRNHSSQQD